MKLLLTTTQLFTKTILFTLKLYIKQMHELFKMYFLFLLNDARKFPLLGLTIISFKWNTFCK